MGFIDAPRSARLPFGYPAVRGAPAPPKTLPAGRKRGPMPKQRGTMAGSLDLTRRAALAIQGSGLAPLRSQPLDSGPRRAQ
jgi:hypothetical protein